MKIWQLGRSPNGVAYWSRYDVCTTQVVIAKDEEEARSLASFNCLDEGPKVWQKPTETYCIQPGTKTARVICKETRDG